MLLLILFKRATTLTLLCFSFVQDCVCVCVSVYTQVCLSICLFTHPALPLIAATNMSLMLHDSVQALAGDGLGHGVPLGQTGL